MTGDVLVVEAGVAETRALRVIGGEIRRFWFGPARGDAPWPAAGMRWVGRIRKIDRALEGAFVDLGAGPDGFLPVKSRQKISLSEGALIEVQITAPARQEKGPVLSLLRAGKAAPGPAGKTPDPADMAHAAIGEGMNRAIVGDAKSARILRAKGLDTEIARAPLWRDFDAAPALGAAFAQTVPLKDGSRLTIDEATALTAIDVDTARLAGASAQRLREKAVFQAAAAACREIERRNIGGRIVIDFPTLRGQDVRARFKAELERLARTIKATANLSGSGLATLSRPREGASLLEIACETAPSDPVAGLRFTPYWRAKAVLREAEERLAAAPAARLESRVDSAVSEVLAANEIWLERLAARYGPRFAVKPATAKEAHDQLVEV